MCSNCNSNSFNNPNGTIGLSIENGNNVNSTVLTTNTGSHNNGDILGTSYNNSYCNDVLGINTSYNYGCNTNSCSENTCNCNGNCNTNNCGCNCNGCTNNNNSCNWNGNNNTLSANITNNNDNVTNNSLQENLRNFIGRRVTLEFNNCGTCSKKTGVLTCVGCNFLTLRGVNNNSCLLVDTAGLNFVTVHNCG